MKGFFESKYNLIPVIVVVIIFLLLPILKSFFHVYAQESVITLFKIPTNSISSNNAIVSGPDGNLWFTENSENKIGRISPSGVIDEFLLPFSGSAPSEITAGPDGNIWFIEVGRSKIGRITPNGIITEFSVNHFVGDDITSGPDGNVWFLGYDRNNNRSLIGRITPTGTIAEFSISDSGIWRIIAGPDGNIWFSGYNNIGKVTPSGVVYEFSKPTIGSYSTSITIGPDGNLWFTELLGNKIGRITPDGVITEFSIPTVNGFPADITTGPDGNLWFTENGGNKIGRITTSGTITEFIIPTGNSFPTDIKTGSDGNLWFLQYGGPEPIGRITPEGIITEFQDSPNTSIVPTSLIQGPDGNLWFMDIYGNRIGRINLSSITPTPSPPAGALNVPLLKQGIAPFNDSNPIWEVDEYDHGNSQSLWCGTTIANCGCAVTSIAMLLRYYNIVSPFDGTVTTPSTVNDYFRQNTQCGNDGCVSLGYAFGDVRWTAAGNYSAEAHQNYNTQKIIYDAGGTYNASVVTQDINEGRPVILGVPNHWVVATGISDNTFSINDPLFNRTFLNDPAYDNTAIQGTRRYKKTNSDFSSVEVAVLAPAQVIITDPNGNKTGFDPNSFTVVNNIPNSSYFFDEAFANEGQLAPPSNLGVYWAIVQTPESGQYEIEIISPQNNPYSFAVYGSDQNSGVDFKLFEGQPSSFFPTRYLFDYSPIPGETTISQQVSIDIKPEGNSDVINPRSSGVVRVAILSTDTFDPMTLDLSSITFGPSSANSYKKTQTKDINGDKRLDRVFYFYTDQTGIANGDTTICLSGKTIDGYNIKGCGPIRTVP